VESHKKFQKDYNLPYELLSDSNGTVAKKFGIKGGIISRITYVADASGLIVFTFQSKLESKKHAEEALNFVRKMNK